MRKNFEKVGNGKVLCYQHHEEVISKSSSFPNDKLLEVKSEEFTTNFACEIDVVYKSKHNNFDGVQIMTSGDAVEVSSEVFKNNRMKLQEQVVVTYLDNQNKVLGTMHVCSGTATTCLMDFKTIFSAGLCVGAVKLIVFHNHPSGILKPSMQDERLTVKLSQAAHLLDMKLLDHIIVNADYDYYSFRENTALLEDSLTRIP